jgi:uncharacterized protein YndB with AHSA1/START domain
MDDFVADMIFIDASPADVFSALTSPTDVLEWFDADEAVIGAWEEGEFTVRGSDGWEVAAVVEAATAGEELVLRDCYWELAGTRHGPSRIRFGLDARDGGVWLSVRHGNLSGGADWETFAGAMRERWVRSTVALKRHIEGI